MGSSKIPLRVCGKIQTLLTLLSRVSELKTAQASLGISFHLFSIYQLALLRARPRNVGKEYLVAALKVWANQALTVLESTGS